MITYKTGNLFHSTKLVRGHGVNCQGVMGSGIAVDFKRLYPLNYEAYRDVCLKKQLKPGMVYPFRENGHLILNIASQFKTGKDANLDWLAIAMWKVLGYCEDRKIEGFAIPRIASGIGGLDYWTEVDPLLHEIFDESPLELELWTTPEQAEKEK